MTTGSGSETFVQSIWHTFGAWPIPVAILLGTLAVWTIVWKGLGLWRAAHNQQLYWFLAFLIINDLGILEIIYLLWFRTDKKGSSMMAPAAQTPSMPAGS